MATLLDLLLDLPRTAPRRLLLVGFDDDAADVARARFPETGIERAARPRDLPATVDADDDDACDLAVVDGRCLLDGDTADVDAVARVHGRLTAGGRLLVALPAVGRATPPSDLPTAAETSLRALIEALSRRGLAWRRDRVLTAGTERWRVLDGVRDPYRVRAYRAGDEDAILELFRAAFGVEQSVAGWRWKYRDQPWGGPLISLVLASDGDLAAHYAGHPAPYWQNGRELLAMHMGDTMTAADHRDAGRGRGSLLARAVRHFFARHRDGRFVFYYGFNTGPIQRFCERYIGGRIFGDAHYRVRELEPGAAPPWPADARYRVERVAVTGRALDRLFHRAAAHYGFLLRRDARWLAWRYLDAPDASYRIFGAHRFGRLVAWSVFRRQGDALVWGDALCHPRHRHAVASLLARAVGHPDLAGAARVECWFPEHPAWWNAHLAALGFEPRPEPQNLGLVYLADDPRVARALADGRFYYAKGDGDLF